MVHPGPTDLLLPEVLAAQTLEVTYTGKPAARRLRSRSAASMPPMPWSLPRSRSGLLRQSLTAGDRVHGIVTVRRRGAEHHPGARRRPMDGSRHNRRPTG